MYDTGYRQYSVHRIGENSWRKGSSEISYFRLPPPAPAGRWDYGSRGSLRLLISVFHPPPLHAGAGLRSLRFFYFRLPTLRRDTMKTLLYFLGRRDF